MQTNIFIFHGTEGYPEENWFPWLKEKLETKGYKVFVPQFPSPPVVPAELNEWFDVFKNSPIIFPSLLSQAMLPSRGVPFIHILIFSRM